MKNSFALLKQQRFAPFFWTQFLGAFNDNVFKNAMVILLAFQGGKLLGLDGSVLVQLCAAVFILPFFLFSATAGQLADKLEKSGLIRFVKLFEIFAMSVGALGFYFNNVYLLFAALFMMGLHSALFGPVKYAILPQHLVQEELLGGNGLVEMGSFVAILLGTVLGGVLAAQPNGGLYAAAATLVFAIAGWLASRHIPMSPPAAPELEINPRFLQETWNTLKLTAQKPTVLWAILGISWFWLYGALVLSQFPGLVKDVLHGKEHTVTLLLTAYSIGVGIGSMLCERLARNGDGLWLVPLGGLGITVFGVDLYLTLQHVVSADSWHLLSDLTLAGICGGLYIVPLYALMQRDSAVESRARVIAGNNIWNALFMVIAALAATALLMFGLTIPQVLLIGAVLNLPMVWLVCRRLPQTLTQAKLRFARQSVR
jgi:MFS family permease